MKKLRFAVELLIGLLVIPPARVARLLRIQRGHVVITGWYGSETIGDIAILGQVIAEVRQALPSTKIDLATFDMHRSRHSLRQLDEGSIGLIPVGARSAWHQATSRALIFGGGPLMESPSMSAWALRAAFARMAGTRVILYGCGIGPIRSESTRRWVDTLVATADLVILRDSTSANFVNTKRLRRPAVVEFDPAYDLVASLATDHDNGAETSVALALRFPPDAYLHDSARAVKQFQTHLVNEVAVALDRLAESGIVFDGIVMYRDENEDDADVYTAIRSQMKTPEALRVHNGPQDLTTVLRTLASAKAVLTMRFHGLVFGLGLGKRCVAIDYARPSGKVTAAAIDAGVTEWVVTLDAITADNLVARVEAALRAESAERPAALAGGPARRVALLAELCADNAKIPQSRPKESNQ